MQSIFVPCRETDYWPGKRIKLENFMRRNKFYYVLLILFTIQTTVAQQNDVSKNYFILPGNILTSEFKNSIGLVSAVLPADYIEEASDFLKAPLLSYTALYGLPNNFAVNAGIRTNIITFHLSGGTNWSYKLANLRLSPGFNFAYMFGQLNQFGFKSKINGWLIYPNFTIGYEFDKFAISFKTEGIFLFSLTEYADDVEVTSDFDKFTGISFLLALEQPLWKDNYLILGFKSNYTKFYYPAWAAFARFDRYYWIPEFTVGIVL